MSKILILIYEYFRRHRIVFYTILTGSFAVMLWFAVQVELEEDVTRFFPDTKDARRTAAVFDNLKVKDKIALMVSAADTATGVAPDRLAEVNRLFTERLQKQVGRTHIKEIFSRVEGQMITDVTDFIYNHLPIFLTEEDYIRLDSVLTEEGLERKMRSNYLNLLSPAGVGLKEILKRDPLGIGTTALMSLQDFQLAANYEIYDGSLFSKDLTTSLSFITPSYAMGSTGKNEVLIRAIEDISNQLAVEVPDVKVEYFGGPSVSVYNARQIKWDTMVTLNIALLIIVVFILLVFRRVAAIPLIILPVVFGAVFALCLISLLKGSISGIAIGAGAAVFGIALSYSIHVLVHMNHVRSPRQLIEELAYPLTVGSFTTVGAFFGLLFTKSELLRDFGLFASLALIGTTIFCLIFLPHAWSWIYRPVPDANLHTGKSPLAGTWLLRCIERMNGYAFDRNKWLVGGILLLTVVCLFTSGWVRFDSDMMNLNFEPEHLKRSEAKLNRIFQSDEKTVLFVSVGHTLEEGLKAYGETNRQLAELRRQGKIKAFASIERILLSSGEQQQRIERWESYWTLEKRALTRKRAALAGERYHFNANFFDPLFASLDKKYEGCDFSRPGDGLVSTLFGDWVSSGDSLSMIVTQVRLDEEAKEQVYACFDAEEQLVIFDRAWFAGKWVSAIHDDFYLILFISSFLVFFALLISYGRLELTLMTFTPMAISWVVILGLMGIFDIPFNIVNIILATFIFGIGDDFSIFIMDGLQNEYRSGKQMLASHKTAIFCSAFTTVVGMGALIFARHPALQSVAPISLLGMIAVVLVAYTVQPLLFRIFISGPVAKGYFPYTFCSVGMMLFAFSFFVAGCLALQILSFLLWLLPVGRLRRRRCFHGMISGFLHYFMKMMVNVRQENRNECGETFQRPAVVIANHQSFVDILVLLSLSPRFIMVTNNWVWHSPFFGRIVRYAGFYNAENGYENLVETLREKVKEGYSVVVFPEGTRSADCSVRRFHKGAFYLSEMLKLDIVPVLLYGNGMVVAKKQPFYVKTGQIASEILPRIAWDDRTYGETYRERTKKIAACFRKEYRRLSDEFTTVDNPWFYHKLMKNYIYKGPVEEWYLRIKVRLEDKYRFFDHLIPRRAVITDIGCGFGPLDYMLMMLSGERTILGIDYDEDKIAVANHCFARTEALRFVCADALEAELPLSDVFVLNDVLHYLSYERQEQLLKRCAAKLNAGGMMMVRDGDTAVAGKHRLTKFTELLSTRIFHFNKTGNPLCFTSREGMSRIAVACGMEMETMKNDRYTSNTIYIFRPL